MSKYGVTAKKESALIQRMATCGLDEKELEDAFDNDDG